MDKIDSDYIVLRELADRIESNPNIAGWYMHRAYMLGCGCSVNDALEHPPRDYSRPVLQVIMGGKDGAEISERHSVMPAAPQQEVTP